MREAYQEIYKDYTPEDLGAARDAAVKRSVGYVDEAAQLFDEAATVRDRPGTMRTIIEIEKFLATILGYAIVKHDVQVEKTYVDYWQQYFKRGEHGVSRDAKCRTEN